MYVFIRQAFDAPAIKAMYDRTIETNSILAVACKSPVTSKRHDARQIVVISRQVLGDDILLKLLTFNTIEVVQVMGEVIDDHLYSPDSFRKDLQLNLVLNVIKDLSTEATIPTARRCEYADDIMRKLPIDSDFKRLLKTRLYDTGSIYRPWLLITRFDT